MALDGYLRMRLWLWPADFWFKRLFYGYRYRFGHYWRLMRHVLAVTDQKLQRMWPWAQFDGSFRLAHSEVDVICIRGYRHVHHRRLGIDQQMVVAGPWLVCSDRGNLESFKAKLNKYRR